MDNALKDASLFNWTARWGTPFWTGPGYALPGGVRAWSWSVVSPLEDVTWPDPAGNRTAIGAGKVSHIRGHSRGGQRLTFWDPWLPLNEKLYEMCGPHRGRFRALNLSASGSFVAVIGPRGDLFTRLYDFDISGHDPVFFKYSYEDQRGKGDGAPIQLPAERWVEQPKIRGKITSAISIHKVGAGSIHRVLRVEGVRQGVPRATGSATWLTRAARVGASTRRACRWRAGGSRTRAATPQRSGWAAAPTGATGCALPASRPAFSTSTCTARRPACACARAARCSGSASTTWTASASRRVAAPWTTCRASRPVRSRARAAISRT